MKIGTKVQRIKRDNYPDCKVGDIGEVVAEDVYTRYAFGSLLDYPDMVLVKFPNRKPSPNFKHCLQIIV